MGHVGFQNKCQSFVERKCFDLFGSRFANPCSKRNLQKEWSFCKSCDVGVGGVVGCTGVGECLGNTPDEVRKKKKKKYLVLKLYFNNK